MKNYRRIFSEIVTKPFLLCLLATLLLSYGFSACNPTLSVDDLLADYYIGSGQSMLASGRLSILLQGLLLNLTRSLPLNAYAVDLLSLFAFGVAAINYCILFKQICKSHFTNATATLFSCVLVSYPLIIEIWEFTGANLNITIGYLLCSVAVLMMYSFFHGEKCWKYPAGAALLLLLVCAGYESVVVVYIFSVFTVLFLQAAFGSREEGTLKTILLQGICYAAVLIVGLLLKILVHNLILTLGGIVAPGNGQRGILWLSRGPKETLMTVLAGIVSKIILKSIIYFPITELVISCLVFLIVGIVLCRKKGAAILLPWFGMYLSLILLPLLQGAAPMYRTCQVYGLFVAVVLMLVLMALNGCHLPRLRAASFFLAGFLTLHQALYINYYLTLNHYRSEAEIHIVEDIGNELQRNFDMDKPVIFVGSYVLSNEIRENASIPENSLRWKLYKSINRSLYSLSPERFGVAMENRIVTETAVQSILNFSVYSPYQKGMQSLFSYNGYDYILADFYQYYDVADDYVQANRIPSYPTAGYIADMGECIVVHLQ